MIRYDEIEMMSNEVLATALLQLHKQFHKKTLARNTTVLKEWVEYNEKAAIATYQAAKILRGQTQSGETTDSLAAPSRAK